MALPIQPGIHISLNGTTWYKLTDHNRSEIEIVPEIIEKSARMANGTLRKYVIDTKDKISVYWEKVPSQSAYTVDYNATNMSGYSSEWLSAFYNSNAGLPVQVKIIRALDPDPAIGSVPNEANRQTALTGSKTYTAFITNFSSTIVWRTTERDFVNMNIEFTEI